MDAAKRVALEMEELSVRQNAHSQAIEGVSQGPDRMLVDLPALHCGPPSQIAAQQIDDLRRK